MAGARTGANPAQRDQWLGRGRAARRAPGLRPGAGACPPGRRPGAAGAGLSAARRTAARAGQVSDRTQRSALRTVGPHRRHPRRRLDRHRRRLWHSQRLRRAGRGRAALGQPGARRAGAAAVQGRWFCRHPHPGAPTRRGGADQRLQLPRLGLAGKVRAQLFGRHADHRQTGQRHQLFDRSAGAADAGIWPAAGGQPATGDRWHGRFAGPAGRPGHAGFHRLGRDCCDAAQPPESGAPIGADQHRGRQPELRHPGA